MPILPKAIYRFNQNTHGILHRNRKNSPNICMEQQKTMNNLSNPDERS